MVKFSDVNNINNRLKTGIMLDSNNIRGTDGNYRADIYAVNYNKKIGEINVVNDNEPNIRSYYLLDDNGAVIHCLELDEVKTDNTNNIASNINFFATKLGY